MNELENIEWAGFMEDCLRHFVENGVEKIMMVTINKDGQVATAFSEKVLVNDLALGGFWLTQEAMSASMGLSNRDDREEGSDDGTHL